jgi:hypothetical protein
MIDLVDASFFEPDRRLLKKSMIKCPAPIREANLRIYGIAEAMP